MYKHVYTIDKKMAVIVILVIYSDLILIIMI